MDELAENKKFDLHIAKSYLPDGWVIVPIEPTEEMIVSGQNCAIDTCMDEWPTSAISIYKAMINEAQK